MAAAERLPEPSNPLGMFNVTNQYPFGAIFQRDMGAKGDVLHRRKMVADMILGYLGSHTGGG